MTRRLQCSHVKPGGAQCGRSAGEGGACRVHTAGYVAKARKPRGFPSMEKRRAARAEMATAGIGPSIAMMGTVPFDTALAALGGDPVAMERAKTFMRPVLPPPEAMHGACDAPPERAACGDFHDEFTLCTTCDVAASAGEERCEDATRAGKAGPPTEAVDAAPKPKRKPRAKPLRDLGVTAPPSSIEEAARAMGVARDYAECEREPWRDAAVRESIVRAAGALVAPDDVPAVVAPCREAASGAALVLAERGVSLYRAEWRELLEVARAAGGVDALICDFPYSSRTHDGHDGGAAQANGDDARWTRSNGRVEAKRQRRDLDYSAWSRDDVFEFVEAWSPLVRGWMISQTDDVLFPHWREAMEHAGRQTFQDVPCVIRGMSVRLVGDGPSSWAIHIAAGRPRTKAMAQWGTLDGAYVGPSERQPVVGGKPVWLARALVRDYSRRGDLIADPGCGGATLGVACIAEGRRALLGDRDAAHVEIAARRLRSCPGEQRRLTLDCASVPMTQASLLETGS